MRYYLPPLSRKETEEYIEKRLRVAGAQGPLFTKKAIKEIYRKSGGIPRSINILCDNALLNGFALCQKIVDVRSVREVAKDLKFGKKSRSIQVWFILCISIAVVILLFAYLQKSGYLLPFLKEVLKVFQYIKEIVMREIEYFSNFFKAGFL
jgi:general secretion pathway protein A